MASAIGGAFAFIARVLTAVFALLIPLAGFTELSLAGSSSVGDASRHDALFALGALATAPLLAALFSPLLLFSSMARMAARLASRADLEAQTRHDKRAPILFLRSFGDDQVTLPRSGISNLLQFGLGKRRLDHILVEQFSRFGPVVAIGRPGETKLPFGAARVYVADEAWQQTVLTLAEKAAYIVLVADASPGVAWEVTAMLGEDFRDKLLLLSSPKRSSLLSNPALGELSNSDAHDDRSIIAIYRSRQGWCALSHKGPWSLESYTVAMQWFFRKLPLSTQC